MNDAATTPLTVEPIGPGWRSALAVLALAVLAVLWIHRETALAMVSIWNRSDTFAHAWVVPPISLWLIWRLRAQALSQPPRPLPWMIVPIAALALVWLLARLVAVNTAAQFALVAMLVSLVPALLGARVAAVLMFPLGFLFFAVPAGDFVMPMFMQWTADFTVAALRLTGIPVYREGLQFVIPSGNWSVVEACSGVRYLIASVMVGTLFAYLNYRTPRRRWIFVGISILVPIVANWLRAYMIVMIGHLSSNKLAVGADHLVYGWVFFGVVIIVLYMIGARWAEAPAEPVLQARAAGDWPWPRGALVAALALAVAALPIWLQQRIDAHEGPAAAVELALPAQLPGGWQLAGPSATPWEPGYDNPSLQMAAAYARGDATVGVYLVYYRQQDDSRKLVSSNHRLVKTEDKAWNALPPEGVQAAGVPFQAQTLLNNDGPALARPEYRVWAVYWVDGRFAVGDVKTKLLGALGRAAGRGDDGAVLLLYTRAGSGADAALAQFAADGLGALRAALDQARSKARQAQ